MAPSDPDLDQPKMTAPAESNLNYPYATSIASSASSSSSSIFSLDAPSSQSSASTSSSSSNALGVVWETDSDGLSVAENEQDQLCLLKANVNNICPLHNKTSDQQAAEYNIVAPEQRVNPRRTNRTDSLGSCRCAGTARPPPSLVRQSDRKVNFVDSLVDSATQLVQIIWPLSVIASRCDSTLGAKGVLPLRIFIQETLRRSGTSYSTLQVALYYLVMIKPHVPKRDFTMEQTDDAHCARALQCGRRMFLAALMLASKYLQDRNYSARAWSKISGLSTQEINSNEMTFLTIINWRLHIPESVFQRWTDMVLDFIPSPPSVPLPSASPARGHSSTASLQRHVRRLMTVNTKDDDVIPDCWRTKSLSSHRPSVEPGTPYSHRRPSLQKDSCRGHGSTKSGNMDPASAAMLMRSRRRAPGMWEGIL
ncbi:MAG: hypothetical protein M1825_002545 [Sarcosagium campestre]|nr:MAG: hypothetical protein M1825_002545 [Sarcosagium campestre]